jgi:hypothetical protein
MNCKKGILGETRWKMKIRRTKIKIVIMYWEWSEIDWCQEIKEESRRQNCMGLSFGLRHWLNFNDLMPMKKKIILCCVHNIIWGYGVNQWRLMFKNSRCTVCSKTPKGIYVTSTSAENFYRFLNNSDNAQ